MEFLYLPVKGGKRKRLFIHRWIIFDLISSRDNQKAIPKLLILYFQPLLFDLHIRQEQIYLTFPWYFSNYYKSGDTQITDFSSLGTKPSVAPWTNKKDLQIFLVKWKIKEKRKKKKWTSILSSFKGKKKMNSMNILKNATARCYHHFTQWIQSPDRR